ncbi:hypothetical protein HaLaN_21974, partial [Haematococcus lacustris]
FAIHSATTLFTITCADPHGSIVSPFADLAVGKDMSVSGTAGSGFTLPPFYSYPPYFTSSGSPTQPVEPVFTINTQQDDFPLFKNTSIDRCLSSRAITEILDDMAS